MGSFSNYLENKVLDHVVGKTSFTMPTAYVALCIATPDDTSTGSTITEPSGGSYARIATAGSDWNASSGGSITNANAVTFATATGDWGAITHFVLVDALTTGNVLCWGALSVTKTILNGDTAKFNASGLTVTLD